MLTSVEVIHLLAGANVTQNVNVVTVSVGGHILEISVEKTRGEDVRASHVAKALVDTLKILSLRSPSRLNQKAREALTAALEEEERLHRAAVRRLENRLVREGRLPPDSNES